MISKKEKLVREMLKTARVFQKKLAAFDSEASLANELDIKRVKTTVALLQEDAEDYLIEPVLHPSEKD